MFIPLEQLNETQIKSKCNLIWNASLNVNLVYTSTPSLNLLSRLKSTISILSLK